MAGFLGAGVGRKVGCLVGMAVRVTIEAGRAAARLLRAAVLGLIVLLLRERRHQKAQAFDLLRRQNAVEQFVVVVDRNELALRDVAEIGALIEVHGRREFGQEVIRDIVIDVEPREVARTKPPSLCFGCGNGKKPGGNRFPSRICSGVMPARLSHVVPAASLTRTPSCTGFVRSIVTPVAGRLVRS